MSEKITMIELFSGVGAQERALRQLQLSYEVINTCDCDANAVLSYAAMRCDFEKELENFEFPSQDKMIEELQAKNLGFDFQKGKHSITSRTPLTKLKQYYLADKLSKNLGDIGKVSRLSYADIVTYSFPCTDLSCAGKGEGMIHKCNKCNHSWPIDFSATDNIIVCPNCGNTELASTRSGLLGEVQRLLGVAKEEDALPKYLLLENVKPLVGKKFKPQFNAWVQWLDGIGYNTYYQILNGKHYGVPQNRERVFAISIRKDIDTNGFTFPETIPLTTRLKDILEKNVDEKYYLPDERIEKILNSTFMQEKKRIQMGDVCGTLLARDWKDPKCVPEPEIIVHNVPQTVRVRVYPVDTQKLVSVLKEHKVSNGLTNKTLATAMNLPLTTVEHWFRTDDCVAIPDPEIWPTLKSLLKIDTEEFDQSIMTFEERDGVYEKSQRVYDGDGIAATLTCAESDMKVLVEEPEIKIVGNYMPSGHDASRVVDINGIAPTVKENHGTVTAIAEPQVRQIMNIMPGTNRPNPNQGRVYDTNGISPALTTMEGGNRQPFVIEEEPFIVASRGRNPENPSDRTPGAPTEQRLEPNFSGCTNTLTSVQKDNYVAEPIIYDDYNSKITKDQDAITTLTTNCGASAERNGVKILEPIVCEERKDEGLRFFKDEVVGTLRTIDACGDKRVIEPSVRWRIRKLTPKCCWRLMGFTDSDCDKAAQYVSNSALYKQAGNSIVTSCLIALFSALLIENGHKAEVWTKYMLHFSDNK